MKNVKTILKRNGYKGHIFQEVINNKQATTDRMGDFSENTILSQIINSKPQNTKELKTTNRKILARLTEYKISIRNKQPTFALFQPYLNIGHKTDI